MKSSNKNSPKKSTRFGKSRKSLIVLAICSLVSVSVVGQPSSIRKTAPMDANGRALTPSRGHYKQLAAISRERSWNTELDEMKSPVSPKDSKWLDKKPVYLVNVSKDEFNLQPPPANSSDQTRAELNYLINLAKNRTADDVLKSLAMSKVYYNINTKPSDTSYNRNRNNLFFIGHSIGNWFNPSDLPLTANLLANVWQDVNYFLWTYKIQYARVRPYLLDKKVNNLEEAGAPSYPGGHATSSYALAYIYQELAPEFTDVFVNDAYEMAHSREIIGVHYPSDSEASRNLARQIVNRLFQNEKFLQDFENVQKEWSSKAKEKL